MQRELTSLEAYEGPAYQKPWQSAANEHDAAAHGLCMTLLVMFAVVAPPSQQAGPAVPPSIQPDMPPVNPPPQQGLPPVTPIDPLGPFMPAATGPVLRETLSPSGLVSDSCVTFPAPISLQADSRQIPSPLLDISIVEPAKRAGLPKDAVTAPAASDFHRIAEPTQGTPVPRRPVLAPTAGFTHMAVSETVPVHKASGEAAKAVWHQAAETTEGAVMPSIAVTEPPNSSTSSQ